MYKFEYRVYRRRFAQPLITHHGLWATREGIIIRLTAVDGRTGWGEIAPLPAFGSERLETAQAYCDRLFPEVTPAAIAAIPDSLPACQFAFESALSNLTATEPAERELPQSGLLPPGQAAFAAWRSLWETGKRTFKWKIAVGDWRDELALLEPLRAAIPANSTLRLDANGGLTWDIACAWLEACDRLDIEMVEQPLPVDQFDDLCRLSDRFQTPIALDESVGQLHQLESCHQRGWRGIFVIKPAIAGFPSRVRAFCRDRQVDVVFSSVLGTSIARRVGRGMAAELAPTRAAGFGVEQWFRESDREFLDALWQN
ncbi:MAG: o-succinylbenzoate synthase [Cyanobacteria bacterium J06642_2]